MSKTDKTKPARFQEAEGTPWREITFNNEGRVRWARKIYWGAQRTAERNALRSNRTPEPSRPRHGVLWDLY